MLISVCIPCYRSAKTLPVLVSDIKEEFSKRNDDYEIILVNDGSPDDTFEIIKQLCADDKKIIGVDLMRNYGQASAKLEAIRHAKGDAVVFMDDDGQHPAKYIFALTDKLIEGGYDVVYAHLVNKTHSSTRNLTSYIYNKVAVAVGVKPKGIHTSSFAAYSSDVARKIREYRSPFVSLGGYVRHLTNKYAEVDIEHGKRIAGKTNYTFSKRLRMFKNIFFSFTMIPLQVATTFGSILSLAGFVGVIYLLIHKILHPNMPMGYTSTNIIMLLIGGVLLITIGIVGEYIGRIYMTISGMPQSTVRTVINEEQDIE
ncbi:MAG: glycosyltransferase family 2 protein [Lachnospiraceae bacterium]|nr:glycosyltransferase family 2 protein [Lachnospiraceae bacterium]